MAVGMVCKCLSLIPDHTGCVGVRELVGLLPPGTTELLPMRAGLAFCKVVVTIRVDFPNSCWIFPVGERLALGEDMWAYVVMLML